VAISITDAFSEAGIQIQKPDLGSAAEVGVSELHQAHN
jgi:hypothetical protein